MSAKLVEVVRLNGCRAGCHDRFSSRRPVGGEVFYLDSPFIERQQQVDDLVDDNEYLMDLIEDIDDEIELPRDLQDRVDDFFECDDTDDIDENEE